MARGGMMDLSDDDKALVKAHLDRGEPLPDRFRWLLFREPRETELIWPGKTGDVTNVVLPFQSIEQIDEPRAETGGQTGDLFSVGVGGRQSGGWSNKLIWGDNKLILSSLKGGPLRREIEAAGGLKLIYIDPPFDVGADFSFDIEIGEESLTKNSSIIEEIAYRDTWAKGADSYISMLYERISMAYDLLHSEGSMYVHVGPSVSHLVRSIMADRFGSSSAVTELVWQRATAHGNVGVRHANVTDRILFVTKSKSYTWNAQYQPYDLSYISSHYSNIEPETGRRFTLRDLTASMSRASESQIYSWRGVRPVSSRCWAYTQENMDRLFAEGRIVFTSGRMPRMKLYLDEMPGVPLSDLWNDVTPLNSQAREDTGYATQKPESLITRILETSSNPGDLVADFFCGSGTTLAVAEKLGRKWIGADLGRFAIHTSRKRLIGVQRQLKAEGKPWRSFEILNLGHYERQWFAGIDPTLPEPQRRAAAAAREEAYVALILEAYKADRAEQAAPFHGHKAGAFVHIGPLDSPITETTVADCVEAARRMGATRVDILGFEYEMGLAPRVTDAAKAKGVNLALRYIPKDVFDRRAIDKGQVTFHDLAYVEASATVTSKLDRTVTVSLTNFAVSYRADGLDSLIAGMKPGSKVTVENGQVVKITKAKDGTVTREQLTKEWTDWIDYWAVDFDYLSRPETIYETVTLPDCAVKHVGQWTGRHIFENEWQSYRTRRDRTLELTSAPHSYASPGRKTIAVKVIDIFGNDTTKLFGVEV